MEPRLVRVTNLNKCHYVGFQVIYRTARGYRLDRITGFDRVGLKISDPVKNYRLDLIYNTDVFVIEDGA